MQHNTTQHIPISQSNLARSHIEEDGAFLLCIQTSPSPTTPLLNFFNAGYFILLTQCFPWTAVGCILHFFPPSPVVS